MFAGFDAAPPARRNGRAPARFVSLLILVLTAASSAFAATFPVFGPERFTVTPGRNTAITRSFSVRNAAGPYYLRARPESAGNARVLLNGTQVLGSADLGREVTVAQKQVQLGNDNVLAVEMSSPGSAISIDIYGIDDEVPSIIYTLNRNPNGAGWFPSDVIVTFQCADAVSGIAGCTSPVTLSTQGTNQVTGVATDRAGNSASTRVTLNIDKTAPLIRFTDPPAGATLTTPSITVRGTIQDSISRVKSATCNGQAVVVSGESFSCGVTLSQGGNQVRVSATDAADNTASANLDLRYAAAATPPAVMILAPATLTAVNASTLDVTGVVRSSNPGSLHVQVNGTTATLSTTVPAGFQRSFTASGVSLREGQNIITATATDGGTSTGSIIVTRDSSAPMVAIDTPAAGMVLTEATVTVAGRVVDVIGPVLGGTVAVSVNGQAAIIRNGSFLAPDLPLVPGPNTFTVTAVDAAGNARSASVVVERQNPIGQRIRMQAGTRQEAAVGAVLAAPLTAVLLGSDGGPVANRSVLFRILRGDGTFVASGGDSRSVSVLSDASGFAQVPFRLGTRSGAGNNVVLATAAGFGGTAVFVASADPGTAVGVKAVFGDGQIGVPGQLLAAPFVSMAHDAAGNPVPGVMVTYAVLRGGGKIDSQDSLARATGSDGRAAAVLTLGTQEGLNNHSVSATIPGLVGLPAIFNASTPASTRTQLRGLILDESNTPVSGAVARVLGSSLQATSGADGQFVLTNAPAGKIRLEVDGSAGGRPRLAFDVVVQPGQDNALPAPVFLTVLDASTKKLVGGANEVAVSLSNMPSGKLTVAPNSVTCPDGLPSCEITFTQLHSDKLPLPPPGGVAPRLNWTIQPSGVRFDPPARLTLPNVEGLRPGQVVDLYTFDYDTADFVPSGTAMVSDDGSTIGSDVGTGLARSGWGFVQSPPAALSCAISCDDGNACTTDTVVAPCFCEHAPRLGGCEDGLYCTSADGSNPGPDRCDPVLGCTGKAIGDRTIAHPTLEFATFGPLMELLDKLNKVGKKVEENVPKAGLCTFETPGKDSEFGMYADIYSRCCEDEDKISSGGLKLAGTANIPLLGVECGYRFEIRKFLKGFLGVGVGLAAVLETSGDFSPCASDLTCKVENSAQVSAEVYVKAEIELLSGLAGASLKGSAAVSVGPRQTCTTLCGLGVVTGDPAAFLLSAIPMNCSTTVQLCFGPVVATGRLKLFGFIRIGFTYQVPGTTWCTNI